MLLSIKTKRTFFLLCSVVLLGFTVVYGAESDRANADQTGYIEIEPGKSRVLLDDSGTVINGWDSYGETYFFIPSYICLSKLDYEKSKFRMYTLDGQLLTEPVYGIMQDVLVEIEGGEKIPYRIGFYKSENLYTINFNSQGADVSEASRESYLPAAVEVISPEGKKVYHEEQAMIKARGNTSWDAVIKKSYEFRLTDKVSFMNMKKSDKWVLLANAMDATKLCDKLAMDLSSDMGMEYAIDSDWVDVYFDGIYWGTYLLCHEPDIGSDDLNIFNLEKWNDRFFKEIHYDDGKVKGYDYDQKLKDVSGGYLIQADGSIDRRNCGFYLPDGVFFSVKSPNNASSDEMDYISLFVNNIDMEIKDTGWSDDLDTSSFARRYLVEEIFYNEDSQFASYYFYKKRGEDRIYAGPCWDYDQLLLMEEDQDTAQQGSILNNYEIFDGMNFLSWDRIMMNNDEYREYVRLCFGRYWNVLNEMLNIRIDSYFEKIRASVDMDYERWNKVNADNNLKYGKYESPEENVSCLKEALYARLCYLAEFYDVNCEFDEPDISTN